MIDLKNKKVVVFGLGVSGISSLRLLHYLGAQTFAINSGPVQKWANAEVLSSCEIFNCFSEDDKLNLLVLENADLIILSPGIPRDHQILKIAHRKNIEIWGEIELGYQVLKAANVNAPIIGITGTNGKTTTTTFLGEILSNCGFSAFIGGNIGIPLCDMAYAVLCKKECFDYIVLELSSFQLESIKLFHPDIVMILNIFQNHGERYSNILDYANAKFNIVNNMNEKDVVIIPSDYEIITNWSKLITPKVISFDSRNPQIDYDLTKFKLPGHHNIVNLKFLLIVAEILKLPRELVQKSINDFRGVHHRIEYVETNYPFSAFNDAKSTNWDATITAVNAMEGLGKEVYLIIGGKKRGHGDSILPHLDLLKNKVSKFILIGEMAEEIESELKDLVDVVVCHKLEKAVSFTINSHFCGVLLFSPGFPSFDQYENYAKRGEHFTKLLSI